MLQQLILIAWAIKSSVEIRVACIRLCRINVVSVRKSRISAHQPSIREVLYRSSPDILSNARRSYSRNRDEGRGPLTRNILNSRIIREVFRVIFYTYSFHSGSQYIYCK